MLQGISQILGKLRVKSALNPALWLFAVVALLAAAIAGLTDGELPIWLVVLIFLAFSVPSIGYFFLLIVDRDKLQSEDYQIRKQSLDLIQEKGERTPVEAESIIAIALPQFDDKKTGGKEQ